jgi:hypothetical protein
LAIKAATLKAYAVDGAKIENITSENSRSLLRRKD